MAQLLEIFDGKDDTRNIIFEGYISEGFYLGENDYDRKKGYRFTSDGFLKLRRLLNERYDSLIRKPNGGICVACGYERVNKQTGICTKCPYKEPQKINIET